MRYDGKLDHFPFRVPLSAPPPISKYYQYHSRRGDPPGAGAHGWGYSGAASQALAGARRRRAVSEGSLSPTVAGNLGTEWSRRGREGMGERGARTRAVGEVPDDLLD